MQDFYHRQYGLRLLGCTTGVVPLGLGALGAPVAGALLGDIGPHRGCIGIVLGYLSQGHDLWRLWGRSFGV